MLDSIVDRTTIGLMDSAGRRKTVLMANQKEERKGGCGGLAKPTCRNPPFATPRDQWAGR
jgi:hypothetical protein